MLSFNIVLVYYDRPEMVRNALESLKEIDYPYWHLSFIDDGSSSPGKSVVLEILGDRLGQHFGSIDTYKDGIDRFENITFYRIKDSKEDKKSQGGSRHPEYMNRAILEREEEIVIILCDDDAVMPNYLKELSEYYSANPEVMYSYCHLVPFNPYTERPTPELAGRPFWLNHGVDGFPYSWVDGSQVSYRKSTFTEGGLRYPSPAHRCLDAHIHGQLSERYGICKYNGIVGQFKGDFEDQLGKRNSGNELEPKDGRYEA